MTPQEFRTRLRALGKSIASFARETGTSPSTVSCWGGERKAGGRVDTPPFPGWVSSLLAAWEEIEVWKRGGF